MAFIQIIEFSTTRMEEGTPHVEAWEKATEGKRTAQRAVLCRDRNDPNHYFNVVFFDSHEAAMENSNMPETQELAQKLSELTDGPPTFYDLDVVYDRT
jgi:hypothetical protein